jgi:hypothetical protein
MVDYAAVVVAAPAGVLGRSGGPAAGVWFGRMMASTRERSLHGLAPASSLNRDQNR